MLFSKPWGADTLHTVCGLYKYINSLNIFLQCMLLTFVSFFSVSSNFAVDSSNDVCAESRSFSSCDILFCKFWISSSNCNHNKSVNNFAKQ